MKKKTKKTKTKKTKTKMMSYNEAKAFLKPLELKNEADYSVWFNENKPDFLPQFPEEYYGVKSNNVEAKKTMTKEEFIKKMNAVLENAPFGKTYLNYPIPLKLAFQLFFGNFLSTLDAAFSRQGISQIKMDISGDSEWKYSLYSAKNVEIYNVIQELDDKIELLYIIKGEEKDVEKYNDIIYNTIVKVVDEFPKE